ncbi:2Fe-2S iron-sulfur cluster-binding protein [Streptomyces chiangmaiensis]|uniref:2Fe-2S iron-sulfur cluster-binding protein n=1 Tax=Streptomyces chiangmaiensis TaxID=766497 RepID=A0ABU7FKW6_9ACTN|nr:2Fe-2S iron-sulfur cluster-binding protein [Streptomyces chiangmaiensis]MED7824332.1 2Fe-2S iron-sulfur cluster-binding protein [Streptomyces chiangmaiensis]
MTDDHREGSQGRNRGSWERLPQGDYDDSATAFVQLPEGGIEALLASDSPLAAPGHGYVPPSFTAAPDTAAQPSSDGAWGAPAEGAQWPEPDAAGRQGSGDRFTYHPGATGQWGFGEAAAQEPPASGHDVTGQWSIPVANGDLPEESGEFSTSSLVEEWGGNPPATLPGGAPAPWVTGAAGQPWSGGTPGSAAQAPVEALGEPSGASYGDTGPAGATEAAQEPSGPAGPPEADQAPDAGPEPAPEDAEAQEPDPESAAPNDEHPLVSYVLRVNGADRPVTDAWIGESLLYVLRERLGLAGAKDGCSQGECGACNVQVDGRLVASCLVPAVTAAGSEVRTVEGLAVDGQPSDVQRALARCGAVQCGFCVPGMAMTVHDLLEGNPAPTELETRQALCGNLCRCSAYRGVVEAVKEVVATRGAHAEADTPPDGGEPRIPHQARPGAGGVRSSVFDGAAPNQHPYGRDGGQA